MIPPGQVDLTFMLGVWCTLHLQVDASFDITDICQLEQAMKAQKKY